MKEYTRRLASLGITPILPVEQIKRSASTVVFRFRTEAEPLVIKCYLSDDSRQELQWYRILIDIGVKTLAPVAMGESEIVFQDMSQSKTYRLGVQSDWANPTVGALLGAWLRDFHRKGYLYLRRNSIKGFNDFNYINITNVDRLTKRYGESDLTSKMLIEHFPKVLQIFARQFKTFVFRDFYFENFVVHRQLNDAFAYDFDRSGTGIAGMDLAYAETYFLGDALTAFMEAYGCIGEIEIFLGKLFLDLFKLIYALDYQSTPTWAMRHVKRYENGDIARLVEHIMDVKG